MKSYYPGKCTECGCKFPVGTEIVYNRAARTAKHATKQQCDEAKAELAKQRAEREASAPVINLKSIADFINAARARGLKNPKLRVLNLDLKTELILSITKTGVEPGSISVVGPQGLIGCVRLNGATTDDLAKDEALQHHLLVVAADPLKAAKQFAAIMGYCCFCGKPLTDEGSTDAGYGPICARNWGQPHTAKGTPQLVTIPSHLAPKQQALLSE